jgi:hypothetical protein
MPGVLGLPPYPSHTFDLLYTHGNDQQEKPHKTSSAISKKAKVTHLTADNRYTAITESIWVQGSKMVSIRTNLMALSGQQHQAQAQDNLSTAMGRLSSGLRVNGAKDDAAGQAIGNRPSSQITGRTRSLST